MRTGTTFLATAIASATLLACTSTPATSPASAPATITAPPPAAALQDQTLMQQLPEFRQVNPRLFTAGQPTPEAWAPLAAQGVTTVVNLRSEAEMQGRDDAPAVAAQGMDYHRIPVGDGADITPESAAALWRLLEQSDGGVLVHCASGNRAGALLAVAAARAGVMAPEQAVEFGRSAGLRSLEPRVRELLGLPAAGAGAATP